MCLFWRFAVCCCFGFWMFGELLLLLVCFCVVGIVRDCLDFVLFDMCCIVCLCLIYWIRWIWCRFAGFGGVIG